MRTLQKRGVIPSLLSTAKSCAVGRLWRMLLCVWPIFNTAFLEPLHSQYSTRRKKV